jgi:hypothetical protein
VPLALGDVTARLDRDGEGFVARYRAPDGIAVRAEPATGLRLTGGPTRVGDEVEFRFERLT